MHLPYRHHRQINYVNSCQRAKKTDTRIHIWNRCTFRISRSPSPDAISSTFCRPSAFFNVARVRNAFCSRFVGAWRTHNRDNHLSLKFIITSESMQRWKRGRAGKKSVRPCAHCFLFCCILSLNFFIRYVCNRTYGYMDRVC